MTMGINHFKALPLMGILRGISEEILEPLTEMLVSSGLKTVEITMNTPRAPEIIRRMVGLSQGKIEVGAGTVLNTFEMDAALEAGASFIVSPTVVIDVVAYCAKNKIPVFPGALTPQEIFNAWQAGATMVKVFPAKFFGPEYFKEIKGPFQNIELLACGGVNPDNINSFFKCGASAVAFGESVFKKDWLSSKDFLSIKGQIRKLIERMEC